MILSIVVLVIVFGVAYFHWVQGLLSAIVSMSLAVVASAVALGYHEAVVASLLGGKMGDYANGMMLCVLFAAVYGIGRLVFDALIPGNVRLPLYLDKVGGAACGLVAGIFCAGTFAVAIQSFPYGASVLGFSRHAIADTRSVTVPGPRRQLDADVSGSLEEDMPDPSKAAALILPADAMVVNYITFQSTTGALAGQRAFADQHPDLLRELFFQRVGVEPGAKHVALNIGGKSEVGVAGLFAPASLPQIEGELASIRNVQGARKLPPQLAGDAKNGKLILIVRTTVKLSAADTDKRVRFSPANARLVVSGKNYFPVGTLNQPGNLLLASRIDDYLLAEVAAGDATIDLVYQLDRADALANGGAAAPAAPAAATPAAATDAARAAGETLVDGAFLELKRYGRVDLSDLPIATTLPPQLPVPQADGPITAGGMLRKQPIREAIRDR